MNDIDLSVKQFNRFRTLIYDHAGISLPDAKLQLVKSRLGRRLRHLGLSSYEDYYDRVTRSDSSDEMGELINAITTNKTDFFREEHHFDFVANKVIPAFIENARSGSVDRRVRVWHAGCSTGEEPYTMAMTVLEALAGQGDWDVKLLASDLDTNVLATGQAGVYGADRVSTIREALLRKYFMRRIVDGEPQYMAKQILKDLIKFRQINLTADVWPIRSDVRFDMIFCRNVVIYFDKPTQRRLFARFAELLKPGGYLFIGHSESLLGVNEDFASLGHTIYRLPASGENVRSRTGASRAGGVVAA